MSALDSLLQREQQIGRRFVRERRRLNRLRRRKYLAQLAGGGPPGSTKAVEVADPIRALIDWNAEVEDIRREIVKVNAEAAAAAAKKNTEKIVKTCTPCLSSHEDHGHRVGISMAEWDKLGCDFCIGKDIYMGSDQAQGNWVEFQEYKRRRTEWEKLREELATAAAQKRKEKRDALCQKLGSTTTLCNGDGLNILIKQCTRGGVELTLDQLVAAHDEFEKLAGRNSATLRLEQLIPHFEKSEGSKVGAKIKTMETLKRWGGGSSMTFAQFVKWKHQCASNPDSPRS